jgi:hypothetical protein
LDAPHAPSDTGNRRYALEEEGQATEADLCSVRVAGFSDGKIAGTIGPLRGRFSQTASTMPQKSKAVSRKWLCVDVHRKWLLGGDRFVGVRFATGKHGGPICVKDHASKAD